MLRNFLLKELQVMVSIGVYAAERAAPQRVLIDAELYLCPSSEPTDDKLHSTLNYDLIRETILQIASARHYDLQETLARALFNALSTLDDVQYVRVRTAKPDAYDDCAYVAYQLGNVPTA